MKITNAFARIFGNVNWKNALGFMLIICLFAYLLAYLQDTYLVPPINAFTKKPTLDGMIAVAIPLTMISLVSIANLFIQFFAAGFYVVGFKNYTINQEQFLPDWGGNLKNFLFLGFKFNVGIMILALALYLIIVISFAIIGIILAILTALLHLPAVIVALVLIAIGVCFIVFAIAYYPAISINFAMVQKFKSIFDFKRAAEVVNLNRSAYFKTILQVAFYYALYIVPIILAFILCRDYYWLICALILIPGVILCSALNVLFADYIKTHGEALYAN